MYVRPSAYSVIPGSEEQAVALCEEFAQVLRDCGVRARVLIGGNETTTLQLIEEYTSACAMTVVRSRLEQDPAYRGALTAWATRFYPLVQTAAPGVLLHDHPQAA